MNQPITAVQPVSIHIYERELKRLKEAYESGSIHKETYDFLLMLLEDYKRLAYV